MWDTGRAEKWASNSSNRDGSLFDDFQGNTTLQLHSPHAQKGKGTNDAEHDPILLQSLVGSHCNLWQESRRGKFSKGTDAMRDNVVDVDAGNGVKVEDKLVLEDGLRGRDKDCSAKCLEEDDNGTSNGHLARWQGGRRGNEWKHPRHTWSDTGKELKATPECLRGRRLEKEEHSSTESSQCCSNQELGNVDSRLVDDASRHGDGKDDGHDKGERFDTRSNRTASSNRLEVDGQKVELAKVSACYTKVDNGTKANCSLFEKTKRNRGSFLHPYLNAQKGNGKKDKADDETNDLGVTPSVLNTTPLKDHEDADETSQDEDAAEPVDKPQSLQDTEFVMYFGHPQKDQDGDPDKGKEDEIDVEAPSPSCMRRKSTSNQGSNCATNAVGCTHDTGQERSLMDRCDNVDNDHGTTVASCETETSNSSSYDKGRRILRHSADEGANLEDGEGNEVDELDVKRLV